MFRLLCGSVYSPRGAAALRNAGRKPRRSTLHFNSQPCFPNPPPEGNISPAHRIDFEVSLSAKIQLEQSNKAAAGAEKRLLTSPPHTDPSDQPDASQEFPVNKNLGRL